MSIRTNEGEAYDIGEQMAQTQVVIALAHGGPTVACAASRGMLAEAAATIAELEGLEALRLFVARVLLQATAHDLRYLARQIGRDIRR